MANDQALKTEKSPKALALGLSILQRGGPRGPTTAIARWTPDQKAKGCRSLGFPSYM